MWGQSWLAEAVCARGPGGCTSPCSCTGHAGPAECVRASARLTSTPRTGAAWDRGRVCVWLAPKAPGSLGPHCPSLRRPAQSPPPACLPEEPAGAGECHVGPSRPLGFLDSISCNNVLCLGCLRGPSPLPHSFTSGFCPPPAADRPHPPPRVLLHSLWRLRPDAGPSPTLSVSPMPTGSCRGTLCAARVPCAGCCAGRRRGWAACAARSCSVPGRGPWPSCPTLAAVGARGCPGGAARLRREHWAGDCGMDMGKSWGC